MRRWSCVVAILAILLPHGGHAARAEGTSPPPSAFAAPEVAELDAALGRLAEVIRWKIDRDLDTIGYAFWAVHDIDRARRPADIAGAPLAAAQTFLAWMRTVTGLEDAYLAGGWEAIASSVAREATSGESWLKGAVNFMHLRSLIKAGETMARGLYGPSYSDSIRTMYDESGRQRTEEAFAAVVRGYLQGARGTDLLAIVPPSAARERGATGLATGSNVVVAAIEESVNRRRGRLVDVSPGEQAEELGAIVAQVDDLTRTIRRSISQNIRLETAGGRVGPWLGSVQGLQRLHAELLGRYASSLRRQQIEVLFSAASSIGGGLIDLHIELGGAAPHADMTVLDLTELGAGAIDLASTVDVRDLLSEVPQIMVWSLAAELELLWHTAESALADVDAGLATAVAAEAPQDHPPVATAADAAAATSRIELDDGTVIVGVIEDVSLPFDSAFGALEIAMGEIAGFAEEKLTLADGSVLKGRFSDGVLPVETARGRIDVAARRIMAIAGNLAHAPPPALAPSIDGVSEPELPLGQGLITGRVVDNFDQAVPGAIVHVDGMAMRSQSDREGNFELPYIPGGFSVSVSADGYVSGQYRFDIAQATVYPAEPFRVFKIPVGEGFFVHGRKEWIRLGECSIRQDSSGWMLVVGQPTTIQDSDVLILPKPAPKAWRTGLSQFLAYRLSEGGAFRLHDAQRSNKIDMQEGYFINQPAMSQHLARGEYVIVRFDFSRCFRIRITN